MGILSTIFTYLVKVPLSGLYGLVIYIRHKLYNWGIFKSVSFDLPIINVGNLTVGGTGKTPHIEYILSILPHSCNIAVLSRGYKRKSRGFQYVNVDDSAGKAGDEPLQIKNNYPEVTVAVEADRVKGVKKLIADDENLHVILLDDAFQHRRINTDFNIILIDYNRPVYADHLLPWGRLRDSKSQMSRAEFIIVTKCPEDMQPVERRMMSKLLNVYPYQKLFFTTTTYADPVPVFGEEYVMPLQVENAVAVAGIATPQVFIDYIKNNHSTKVEPFIFPDHHNFTKKDIQRICKAAQKADVVLTTQKDSQRLFQCGVQIPDEIKAKFFYIPIKVVFLWDKELFTKYIIKYARTNKNYSRLY